MLPPTERASVLQLVRLGPSCIMWEVDSLASDSPARIIRYSLTLPVVLLPLVHSLCVDPHVFQGCIYIRKLVYRDSFES
jgi:hypothetical protein